MISHLSSSHDGVLVIHIWDGTTISITSAGRYGLNSVDVIGSISYRSTLFCILKMNTWLIQLACEWEFALRSSYYVYYMLLILIVVSPIPIARRCVFHSNGNCLLADWRCIITKEAEGINSKTRWQEETAKFHKSKKGGTEYRLKTREGRYLQAHPERNKGHREGTQNHQSTKDSLRIPWF